MGACGIWSITKKKKNTISFSYVENCWWFYQGSLNAFYSRVYEHNQLMGADNESRDPFVDSGGSTGCFVGLILPHIAHPPPPKKGGKFEAFFEIYEFVIILFCLSSAARGCSMC